MNDSALPKSTPITASLCAICSIALAVGLFAGIVMLTGPNRGSRCSLPDSGLAAHSVAYAAAQNRFEVFKRRFEASSDADVLDLLSEGRAHQQDYEASNMAWKPELLAMLDRLERVAETAAVRERRMDFQVVRNDITTRCNLRDRHQANWGLAVSLWDQYIALVPSPEAQIRAQTEIQVIYGRAKENLDILRKKTELLVLEEKNVQAAELLQLAHPRFEHTRHAEELDKLIQELER